MSTKDTGGPAFPSPFDLQNNNQGMATRDYFAAKALQALINGHIARYGHDGYWSPDDVASYAYECADAMLKARNA